MPRGNIANLVKNEDFTPEERRERASRAGKASARAKLNRKTLREELKLALSCAIPKTSPLYSKMKRQMRDLGLQGSPMVQHIPVLGMLLRAGKDPNAFNTIRDTIGEKPTETYQDLTPQAPIVLGMVPLEKVEQAKREHEERQKENPQ